MSKKCNICGSSVGILSGNKGYVTKDNAIICSNCFHQVFNNINKNHYMQGWAYNHTIQEFKDLLSSHKKYDLEAIEKERLANLDKQRELDRQKTIEIKNKAKKSTNCYYYDDYYFDNNQQKIVANGITSPAYYYENYSDVVSYTPINNGHNENKKHGITRAVVGGALLGGIGAVVGATTGGKHYEYIDKLAIQIGFKDDKQIIINFITKKTKAKKAEKQINEFNNLCTLLDGIIAKNNHQEVQNVNVVNNDPAGQLRKLKLLVDEGIISEEEFEAKKKQILGI